MSRQLTQSQLERLVDQLESTIRKQPSQFSQIDQMLDHLKESPVSHQKRSSMPSQSSQIDQMLAHLKESPVSHQKRSSKQATNSQIERMIDQLITTPVPKKQLSSRIKKLKKPTTKSSREDLVDQAQWSSGKLYQIPNVIQDYQSVHLNEKLQRFSPYLQQAQKISLTPRFLNIGRRIMEILPGFQVERFLKIAVALKNQFNYWLTRCRNLNLKVASIDDAHHRLDKLLEAIESTEIQKALNLMMRLHTSIEHLKEKYSEKEKVLNQDLQRFERLLKLNPHSMASRFIGRFKQTHPGATKMSAQDFLKANREWENLVRGQKITMRKRK